jgi:nitroreductase
MSADATPAAIGLLEGIATTRAIRRYLDEPIPDEALRDILFAATRGPSGSNRQPFRFVVLTDSPKAKEAKRLIGSAARSMWSDKRRNDGYDQGSGADESSPKARMARTMQSYVDESHPHRRRFGVPRCAEPAACSQGTGLRWRHHGLPWRRGRAAEGPAWYS